MQFYAEYERLYVITWVSLQRLVGPQAVKPPFRTSNTADRFFWDLGFGPEYIYLPTFCARVWVETKDRIPRAARVDSPLA